MMGYGRFGGGYPYMAGGHWLGGAVMFFFGLLFLMFLVMVLMRVLRGGGCCGWHGHGHMHPGAGPVPPVSPSGDPSAEAVGIAKRRLASGEITGDEYQEIMKHLGS